MKKLGIGLALFFGGSLAFACGSSTDRNQFGDGTDPTNPGGSSGTSGSSGFGGDATAAPQCVGLQCQQVSCGGGATTSISGVVLDPAGKNPVYNVVVYVPNEQVAAISHGPVCDSCGGAPVTGNPVVTTLTDATGHFQLNNVPVTANLPVVLQIGKWRRQITLSTAPTQCQDNPVADTDLLRLPKNQSEGDMPLIALTSGCDPIHSLVQKIGIDPSEFTNGSGSGMVHIYNGKDYTVPGVSNATDAYAFWNDLTEMMKYDIIINECECEPYPRDSAGDHSAYTNIQSYLDAGGRAFNSHYHLNFLGNWSDSFGSNTGKVSAETSSAADFGTLFDNGFGGFSNTFLIDTSFPKGQAMSDWMENLKTASKWGASAPHIKSTPKGQVDVTDNGDIKAAKAGVSQRWIYPSDQSSVTYLSINTPTSKDPADRCGRAVATDLHVGSGTATTMTEQEAALEFMFFDLASCVIDDSTTPTAPPVK